jgi:hypothetical protein
MFLVILIRKPDELAGLIRSSRSFMASIVRAKTAKIGIIL